MRPLLSLSVSFLIAACPSWAGDSKTLEMAPLTITAPRLPRGPALAVEERAKKAAAEVEAACAGKPAWPQCAEARAILEEALDHAKKTRTCPGDCPELETLVFQAERLSERYFKLKPPGDRDLLSLFMLTSESKDHLAAIRPADPDKVAAIGVEAFCASIKANVRYLVPVGAKPPDIAPAGCVELRRLLAEVLEAAKKEKQCAAAPCTLAEFERLNTLAEEAPSRLSKIDPTIDRRLAGLFSMVYRKHPELDSATDKAFQAALSSLSRRVTLVEQKTGRLTGAKPHEVTAGLAPLGAEGQGALEAFQELSLFIDRLGQPKEKRVLALREKANGIAVRLGNLRDQLIALQQGARLQQSPRLDLALLLKGPADAADGERWKRHVKSLALTTVAPVLLMGGGGAAPPSVEVPQAVTAAASPSVQKGAQYVLTAPRKTLLDAPRVAPPAPVLPFSDLDKSLSLQEVLFTKVVGAPVERAKLVHAQTGPTCAVVSQQQILQAYGVIKPVDPKKEEVRLRDLAASKGYYANGTPSKFEGNILLDQGMIISKHANASDAQLDRAVLTGKILLVTVDAGRLWDNALYNGGSHAIVVTGARVSRLDGRVTGYYINDSGSAPMSAGRYLPAEKFLKAFHAGTKEIIEVQ